MILAAVLMLMGGRTAWSNGLTYNPPVTIAFPPPGDPFSQSGWSQITPIVGQYSYLYIDYMTDGTLLILNDWHGDPNDIAGTNLYNYFNITDGSDDYQVWVYANPADDVIEDNGAPISGSGYYYYGTSPTDSSPHTIYEFEIPGFSPGPRGGGGVYFNGSECDEIITNGCDLDNDPDDIPWLLAPDEGGGDDAEITPEPWSLLLLGTGAFALAGMVRRSARG
jgi:hypothetical protein